MVPTSICHNKMGMNKMKIGVIGAGNMGTAMIKGWIKAGQNNIAVMNPENPRVTAFCDKYHLPLFHNADEMIDWQPDVLMFTTPAKVTLEVVKQFAGIYNDAILVSAAAGVRLNQLEDALPNHSWTRIIPNIPVEVNAGTIGMTFGQHMNETTHQIVSLMKLLGDVIPISEDQLNIVGTIGGCGSAFIDVIMDALSDAAVKHGLDREKAYQLVSSMVAGTGKLALESKLSPSTLRDQVTSPGGTTIRGVQALEKHGVRFAMMDAVDEASEN